MVLVSEDVKVIGEEVRISEQNTILPFSVSVTLTTDTAENSVIVLLSNNLLVKLKLKLIIFSTIGLILA